MGTQKNTIRRGGCIKESIKMRFLTIFSLAVVICVAICADSSKTEKKELKERDESEKKAPLENVMYADDDKAEDNEKMEEEHDNVDIHGGDMVNFFAEKNQEIKKILKQIQL